MVRGGLRRTWRLHSPFPLFPIPASPAPGRLEILDALAERALDGVVPVAAFVDLPDQVAGGVGEVGVEGFLERRSEEHTSELQSLMRISYAVFCWKKKKYTTYMLPDKQNKI